jgi:anti-anti-sigma factor
VAACGQLDLSTAWQLERELRRAEAADVRSILLDLSGLEFIDSVGMDVVIHASARTRHHSKHLMIRRGPEAVHRTFEVSGLVPLLPFVGP